MNCPLCGFQFEKTESVACKSCPVGANTCNLLCCPNCGYQWTDESKIISTFRKWFGKKEANIGPKD